MSRYIAYPVDETQDKALKAVLEALRVPYETEQESADETSFLLASEANKVRLLGAIENEDHESRVISLDEIWK